MLAPYNQGEYMAARHLLMEEQAAWRARLQDESLSVVSRERVQCALDLTQADLDEIERVLRAYGVLET